MSEKKNFMLRLDLETFKALEKWAADEFRSINGQIEFILSNAIKQQGRSVEKGIKREKNSNLK